MHRPTRTSRGEQPAGIRCARSMLCRVNRPANSARGVDSARIGEGRRTPPTRLAQTCPALLKPIPPPAPSKAGTLESMRIARFTVNNELHFGLVEGDAGEETLRVLAGDPFYSGIEPTGTTYPIDQVRLLAPIIPRSKVIGAIANWAGTEAPASPQFFLKPNTTVIGPGDPVTLPEYSEAVSAEGELAVIIGRIAKSVPLERVHEVIFGYTVANDLTARDLLEDRQWTRAKGFDGSTPLGPWIETDLDTDSLNITTWVDGDVVQEGNTSEMHYSVAEQVAAASEIFTLLPGDVLLTGTPAGISVLRDGNEVEVEVEGIGSLVTRVRD